MITILTCLQLAQLADPGEVARASRAARYWASFWEPGVPVVRLGSEIFSLSLGACGEIVTQALCPWLADME